MTVNVILHKNAHICPIDFDSVRWSAFRNTKNVFYGSFDLEHVKYIDASIDYASHSVSVHCSPLRDDATLERSFDKYNHPNYWYVEVIFEVPEDLYIQSYTITPTKGAYEIWVIAVKWDEYSDHITHLRETKKPQIQFIKNVLM